MNFFLFLSYLLFSGYWHEMHNSLADMSYNPSSDALEVQLTIYTDDLLTALVKANPGKKVKVDASKEASEYIHQYLSTRFMVLDAANRPKPLTFLGEEITSESVRVRFEVVRLEKLKNKKLKNIILVEVFDDQVNMVNMLLPSGISSYLMFQKDKPVLPIGE